MPSSRAVAAAVLLTCATIAATAPAAQAPAPAARGPFSMHVAGDHRVAAPAVARPGIADLHNSGSEAIAVIETSHHVTNATVARVLNKSADSATPVIPGFTIIGFVDGHHSLYAQLPRGTVFLFSVERDHFRAADVHRVRIQGRARNADVSGARPLTLDRGNRLTVAGTIAKRGLFRVANASRSVDVLIAIQVGPDVARRTIDAFVAHPTENGIDALHPADLEPIAIAFAHSQVWVSYGLAAGRWVVIASPVASSHFARAGQVRALVVR